MINLKYKKGFTLTEMMVTLTLFTVIIAAIYTTFAVGNRSWLLFNTNAMLQRETRDALMYMTKELRKSKDVLVIKDDESVRVNFMRSPMGPISYIWTSVGPDANKLIRKNQSNSKVLAGNVTSLTVEYLKEAILIDVTSGVKRPSGEEITFRLKDRVALRN